MSHAAGGLIMIAAVVYAVMNMSKLQKLDVYHILVLILLFSIVVTIHGLSHVLLEKEYNYVPLNLWELPKKKVMECPCMKYKGKD
jgi:uncharacterized membrane protein